MGVVDYQDPAAYSKNSPIHIAIYGYNGVGKTTFAGNTGLRTVLLDCGDAGAVTLRKAQNIKIVRIRSILHFLDVVEDIIRKADDWDLVVADTLTGLQSRALKEVKGRRNFEMNQRKWGQVGSRVIECLSELDNFPKDVIYLIQERKRSGGDDEVDNTSPSLTPSIKGFMSSLVDWVGWLHLGDEGKRYLDFRISEGLEAKDRANLFPKLIANPSYVAIRKRIVSQLKGEVITEKEEKQDVENS